MKNNKKEVDERYRQNLKKRGLVKLSGLVVPEKDVGFFKGLARFLRLEAQKE